MIRRPKYVIEKQLVEAARLREATVMAEPEQAMHDAGVVASLVLELLDPPPLPELPTPAVSEEDDDLGRADEVCPGVDGEPCGGELVLMVTEQADYRVETFAASGVLRIGKNWGVSDVESFIRCDRAGHQWAIPAEGVEHQ